jgi:ribosomal silencing factor RsfS
VVFSTRYILVAGRHLFVYSIKEESKMNKKRNGLMMAAILLILHMVFFGCETDPAPAEGTFTIRIDKKDDVTGDTVTVSPDTGKAGDTVTLTYTVADTMSHNLLEFSGVTATIAYANRAGNGTETYTIDAADAINGVITITAVFKHIALDWSKVADYDTSDGDLILGTAAAAFDGTNGRYQETIMGNFTMDGLAEYARYISEERIDFALHNDSFMRNNPSLSAGEISNSDITGISGMTDTLVVATFTGKQVKDVIDGFVNSSSTGSWNRNCAVIVSKELSYTIDMTTNPPHAANVKVNDAAIVEDRDYRIAVGNFIGDNTTAGRFLPVLPDEKKTKYAPTTLAQAVALYILAKGKINPSDYPLGRYTGTVPVTPGFDWSKITGYDTSDGDLILGTAAAAFDGTNGRYQETVMGNFTMDGLAEYARYISGERIDFALHNDSFMRNNPSLSAGEISNSGITGISGMTDTLVVATFTGKQVKDVIDGFVSSTTAGTWSRNCAVIVSKELSYTIDTSTTPPHAVNVKVNNAAIVEDRDYRIAVGNFIGDNTTAGRFLPVLPDEKKTKYAPTTLAHAVAMYVLSKGTIKPSDYPLGRYTGTVPALP